MGANHSRQITSSEALCAVIISLFFPFIAIWYADGCGVACWIEIFLWLIFGAGGFYQYWSNGTWVMGYGLPITMFYAWYIIAVDTSPVNNGDSKSDSNELGAGGLNEDSDDSVANLASHRRAEWSENARALHEQEMEAKQF
ncbi:hypothetical protein T439DRAFT_352690 [Meredithblackwellia eburnea MCA 4105]